MTSARKRDATRSKQELLQAAAELFSERGYDRTTLREVGERAGVDPALVARYFGGKVALYVATLKASAQDGVPDLLQPGRVAQVLRSIRRSGSAPLLQAALQPHDDPDVQAAARETLALRLTAPLTERLADAGHVDAHLRAEVAIAALAGIGLGLGSGAFPALSDASDDELAAVTTALLAALRDA